MRLQTITRMSASGLKDTITPLAQWQRDGLRDSSSCLSQHAFLFS